MMMRFKNEFYPIVWKTQMRGDMWYSMEPAKIKITMPASVYDVLSKDINRINNDPDRDSCYRLSFDVIKFESDNVKWRISYHKSGVWRVNTFVYNCTVSSKFRNGDVIAIFDIAVDNADILDKSIFTSILRDRILNELV